MRPCCCLPTKIGTAIIAGLEIIDGLVLCGTLLVSVFLTTANDDKKAESTTLLWIILFPIIVSVFRLGFGILLCWGVYKNSLLILVLWLCVKATTLVAAILYNSFKLDVVRPEENLSYEYFDAFMLFLNLYYVLVVSTHAWEVRRDQQDVEQQQFYPLRANHKDESCIDVKEQEFPSSQVTQV